ncbi:MAG: ComF family protein [Planctomycetia bacterium]|nr:ComF family protein [Planctomycetia bacterium]
MSKLYSCFFRFICLKLFNLRNQILELFYTSECIVCYSDVGTRTLSVSNESNATPWIPLCSACQELIVLEEHKMCRFCAGSKYVKEPSPLKCNSCSKRKFLFQKVVALGKYEGILRYSILKMKNELTRNRSTVLARLLYEIRRMQLEELNVDLIIPVPMFRLRKFRRGVNSSELIAQELAIQMKVPICHNAVRRIRATQPQFFISTKERFLNVRNAFQINPKRRNALKDKRILLVDDILTSGATCNEISRILLEANVSAIFIAVLARAEGRPKY